jgi:hypothetical protein
MNKLISLALVLFFFSFAACSSLEGDAQKAAKLNKESMQYAKEGNLEEAEKAYKDVQQIIDSYKDTEHYGEFYAAYNKYMREKDNF